MDTTTRLKTAIILVVLQFTGIGITYGQSKPPDTSNDPISPAHSYYPNFGQIIDNSGTVRNDILYYTENTAPRLYFFEDFVSFTMTKADTSVAHMDTSYRIDMKWLCDVNNVDVPCPSTLIPYDSSGDYLNYYLPHCPSNGITNVGGFKGLVYQDAIPGIDLHFSSNDAGPKAFFVIQPGANPAVNLKFTGQDSIATVANYLSMYAAGDVVTVQEATAYQFDPALNTYVAMPWMPGWVNNGNGLVGLSLGTYDQSQELYIKLDTPTPARPSAIDNMQWCTFYGSNDRELLPTIHCDNNNNAYHSMAQIGGNFLTFNGLSTSSGGGQDLYISLFKNTVRTWSTYFGGSGDEYCSAIAEGFNASFDAGDLYISGNTTSTDLKTGIAPIGFHRTVNGGGQDGLFLSMKKHNGELIWSTYFGGNSTDEISAISIDNDNQKLYFTGTTNSSIVGGCSSSVIGFPICSPVGRYNQLTSSGQIEGFVGEFDILNTLGDNFSLNWNSYLGGLGNDLPTSIKFSLTTGSKVLYVAGNTQSQSNTSDLTGPIISKSNTDFPIVNPGTTLPYVQYIKSSGLVNSGFLVKFNNDFKLEWSTFFGGDMAEEINGIGVNTLGDIYICGTSNSTNSNATQTANNITPILATFNNGSSYSQNSGGNRDCLIAKFSPNNTLLWSTRFGGTGVDVGRSIAFDMNNNLYVAGTTDLSSNSSGNIPTLSRSFWYTQADNASLNKASAPADLAHSDDGFLAMFSSSNIRLMSTHFGGHDYTALGISEPSDGFSRIYSGGGTKGEYLYFTGNTHCRNTPNSPSNIPLGYYEKYKGNGDAFIGRFDIS